MIEKKGLKEDKRSYREIYTTEMQERIEKGAITSDCPLNNGE
jgi:hypothetical protein